MERGCPTLSRTLRQDGVFDVPCSNQIFNESRNGWNPYFRCTVEAVTRSNIFRSLLWAS